MAVFDVNLLGAMQQAIANDEFVLHYQPQVDLASGEVLGLEALLRWQHPERGLLEPREFLSTAVGSELIVAIGRWVLEQVGREVKSWRTLPALATTGHLKQVWVNVSAVELAQAEFLETVRGVVDAGEIPLGVLGMEISEADLIAHSDELRATLDGLRELGVLLAVDDFGTWYSSLAGLKGLPLDAVKLGHQFVRGVGQDLAEDAIVASVVNLVHARGLVVVAEGVESWTEGARLCEMGCDRAHGYLFSGPQRADRARSMLTKGTGWNAPGAGFGSDWPIPDPRATDDEPAHRDAD